MPQIEMTEAADRAGYPPPSDIVEGALSRFRNEVLLERDQIAPDTMTLGALRYFQQHYCTAMAEQQVLWGIPGTAEKWGQYSAYALQQAANAYNRDQKPQEQPQPGVLSGPIGVQGRAFTVPE